MIFVKSIKYMNRKKYYRLIVKETKKPALVLSGDTHNSDYVSQALMPKILNIFTKLVLKIFSII
jgi:hypothetical protein